MRAYETKQQNKMLRMRFVQRKKNSHNIYDDYLLTFNHICIMLLFCFALYFMLYTRTYSRRYTLSFEILQNRLSDDDDYDDDDDVIEWQLPLYPIFASLNLHLTKMKRMKCIKEIDTLKFSGLK